MSSLHNYVAIYLSFYLLESLMIPSSMLSSSSQVAPKGVHCIQTFCSAESCHTRLYSLSGTCFPLLQATRLSGQLNLTTRDPAPDNLKNKVEGKNKPGGIEIYRHGGNGAKIQWNSCDNDGAIHINLYYLAPFFTQPTDDEKFTLLRILISQWTLVTCVTLIR